MYTKKFIISLVCLVCCVSIGYSQKVLELSKNVSDKMIYIEKNKLYKTINNLVNTEIFEDGSRCKAVLNNNYVEYQALNINFAGKTINDRLLKTTLWGNTENKISIKNNGFKEIITLKNDKAPTEYKYLINTNLDYTLNGNHIDYDGVFYTNIIATDNNIEYVPLDINIINDTLIIRITTDGYKYPIEIDPSVLHDEGSAIKGTYIQSSSPSNNWGAYGPSLSIKNQVGGLKKIALLEFPTDSILYNYKITKAELRLYCNNKTADDGGIRISLLRRYWEEGTGSNSPDAANYDSATHSVAWTTPGALDTASDIHGYDTLFFSYSQFTAGTWDSLDITDLYQKIRGIDSVWNDYGFHLQYINNTSDDQIYFDPDDGANPPKLYVEYNVSGKDTISAVHIAGYDAHSVRIDSVSIRSLTGNGIMNTGIYNTYFKKWYNSNGDTTSTATYLTSKSDFNDLFLYPLGELRQNILYFIENFNGDTVLIDTVDTAEYVKQSAGRLTRKH